MTLEEFLLARLDEDEAAARSCAAVYLPPWDVYDRGHSATVMADAPNFTVVCDLDQDQVAASLGGALSHIARHDPARVLREVAAKRRLVNAHQAGFPDGDRYRMGWHDFHAMTWQLLALAYVDHPDYERQWAPLGLPTP